MDKGPKNLQMVIFTKDSMLVGSQMDTENTIGVMAAISKEALETA
jgi:hypothetical protein